MCQKLGPLQPPDLSGVEWGFTGRPSYCGLFQKGPQGLARPSLFYQTAQVLHERFTVAPPLRIFTVTTEHTLRLQCCKTGLKGKVSSGFSMHHVAPKPTGSLSGLMV